MTSTEFALGEEDLNLSNMDMSLEDADLFKYFLNEDLSNIEGAFRNDFESSLSDISVSPQTTPNISSPENIEYNSYLNTASNEKESSSDEIKVKKEPVEKSDSKKRGRDEKKTSLSLSRDDLLKLSSKGLENYAQNLAATRPLTQEEERQLKRQRRLIKNRESAQLSRLRKKIYIEELERKLSHMSQQNENLTKQVQTLQVDKKKLAEEVLYLQNIIKQSPQLTAAAAQGKKHSTMPKNVKAAGVCLLIVLFSFGLLFNATQPKLPFSQNNDGSPEVIPKSSLYTGRVLKSSIKEEDSLSSQVSLGKEPQKGDSLSISTNSKRSSSETNEPKRKKMKISEESEESNKSLVPLEPSQVVGGEKSNTSYIFCPQAQQVFPANSDPSNPEVVALLIPTNTLTGNFMGSYAPGEIDSLLEVSCQVLSLNIWPIANATN